MRPRSAIRASRGFTLVELMVVVVIIAIVATVAMPTMIDAQYDRRVFTDAASTGEIVREARARATGRGAAQVVTLTATQSTNSLAVQISEEVVPDPAGGGVNTPYSRCTGGAPAGLQEKFVDAFVFGGTASLEGQGQIVARLVYPYGAATAPIADGQQVRLCFTPIGRAYFWTGTPTAGVTPVMTPMTGALGVEFTRGAFPLTLYVPNSTRIIRTVWVPPSGATRITSH